MLCYSVDQTLLSPGGVFYLLTIDENKPDEIAKYMLNEGFSCKVFGVTAYIFA